MGQPFSAAAVAPRTGATAWRLEERTASSGAASAAFEARRETRLPRRLRRQGLRGVRGLADALPEGAKPKMKRETRTRLVDLLLV